MLNCVAQQLSCVDTSKSIFDGRDRSITHESGHEGFGHYEDFGGLGMYLDFWLLVNILLGVVSQIGIVIGSH